MRFDFIKCHGSGNDFPLIDARDLTLSDDDWARVARALADRAGPVGGDGLLLLTAGDAEHAFGMRMFNSDGSEAETCLNGLRCVARAGFEALSMSAARVRLKTSSAEVVQADAMAPGVVTILETAGPATTGVSHWPLTGAGDPIIEGVIPALDPAARWTAVAIPNPHLLRFVEAIDEAALVAAGEICEAAPDWLPNRANVSFIEQRGGDLFVRTFERGVGLTDSCGSAMAASAYAACLTARLPFERAMTVFNRGGKVMALVNADGTVSLSGNATFEWAGSVSVEADGVAGVFEIGRRYDDEVAAWAAVVTGCI